MKLTLRFVPLLVALALAVIACGSTPPPSPSPGTANEIHATAPLPEPTASAGPSGNGELAVWRGNSVVLVEPASGAEHILVEQVRTGVSPAFSCGPATGALAWSPDGTWLAFTTADACDPRLEVVRADGSDRRRIGEATEAAWAPSGQILASPICVGRRVTGAITCTRLEIRLTDLASDEVRSIAIEETTALGDLTWSPDGTRIAFTAWTGSPRVWIVDLGSEAVRRIGAGWVDDWSPDGHQLLVGRIDGDPSTYQWNEYVVPLDGAEERLLGLGRGGSWSPDGTRIASLWIRTSYDTSVVVRATDAAQTDAPVWQYPATSTVAFGEEDDIVWSPDGNQLAFTMTKGVETSIFVVAPWDGVPTELGTGTALAWRPVLD